ncbi:MAG TPA: hypothetical protein VEC35_09590 [Noviherbaspirillum sp.]|nr:hypothetical protein [Noviherbaspirillum sp.]
MPTAKNTAEPTVAELKAELAKFSNHAREVAGLGLKSKAAEIRLLMDQIEHMNGVGFSLEKLCEVMGSVGLDITPPVLKTTMGRERAKGAKAAPKKKA